jgi:hypothetical protein
MNGNQIITKTYAVNHSTAAIEADKAAFAAYIDMIIGKADALKAAGASKLDANVTVDKVIRGFARKTWGGNEKSYMLDGAMLTVSASTLNAIVEMTQAEVVKVY